MRRLRILLVTTSLLLGIILILVGSAGTTYWWSLNPDGDPAYSAEISGFHLIVRRTFGRVTAARFFIPMNVRQPFRFLGFRVRKWDGYGVKAGSESLTAAGDGINVNVAGAGPPEHQIEIALPLWVVIVLLALLSAGLIVRDFRQSRGGRPGTCSTCGYDLRASKERCPECGTPIPPKVEAAAGSAD